MLNFSNLTTSVIILAILVTLWPGNWCFTCKYSTNIVKRVVSPKVSGTNVRYQTSLMKCVQSCFFRSTCSKVYFSSPSSICIHVSEKAPSTRKGYIRQYLVEVDLSLWPSRLALFSQSRSVFKESGLVFMTDNRRNDTKKPTSPSGSTTMKENVSVRSSEMKMTLKLKIAMNSSGQLTSTLIPMVQYTTSPTNSSTREKVDRKLTSQHSTAVKSQQKPKESIVCPSSYPWPPRPKKRILTKEICLKIPGYKYARRSSQCLRYHDKNLAWNEARAVCLREGGDLIMLNTRPKKRAYRRYIRKIGMEESMFMFMVSTGMWIGQRTAPDGMKRWVDNSLIKDRAGDCEQCAATGNARFHMINYHACSEKKPFVCELN